MFSWCRLPQGVQVYPKATKSKLQLLPADLQSPFSLLLQKTHRSANGVAVSIPHAKVAEPHLLHIWSGRRRPILLSHHRNIEQVVKEALSAG